MVIVYGTIDIFPMSDMVDMECTSNVYIYAMYFRMTLNSYNYLVLFNMSGVFSVSCILEKSMYTQLQCRSHCMHVSSIIL